MIFFTSMFSSSFSSNRVLVLSNQYKTHATDLIRCLQSLQQQYKDQTHNLNYIILYFVIMLLLSKYYEENQNYQRAIKYSAFIPFIL